MNKRSTILYFIVVLIAGFIVACSGEEDSTANSSTDLVVEPGEDTTSRELGFFERTQKHPFNNQLLHAYKLAKKNGKLVTYFSNTYRGSFFLIQNQAALYDKKGNIHSKIRFGLIDAKGKQLLATEFERIGNPGFIVDDHVEVKKDGKYGLFNYATNKLITPEFDAIYPSKIMEYIAIGQKGTTYYKIYADGKTKPFAAGQGAPNYARLLKTYQFNSDSEFFGLWITTDALDAFEKEEYYASYSSGMIVTPSYMTRLAVFPDLSPNLTMNWSEFGDHDSLNIDLIDSKQRNETVYSMITSFYSYTADARGYETNKRYLVTLDKTNSIQYAKQVLEYDNYNLQNGCSNGASTPSVKFINDSVVAVKNYIEIETTGLPYSRMTQYSYYSIAADGKVNVLSNGLFPMTNAIVMTKESFKGCFARQLTEEDAQNSTAFDEDLGNLSLYRYTDHLALADLEYMRNEIYARHGMKFSDAKWTETFSEFSWYNPKKSNVESLLTPLEKKNIQLIKQLEKELKNNPEALIHEEDQYMVFAG